MERLAIYGVLFVAAGLAVLFASPNSAAFTLLSGAAIALAMPLIDSLVANWKVLRVVWYTIRMWRRRVRISASYLYRIKLRDEYMLVKGNRFKHYQPVGGVYKYSPAAIAFLRSIDAVDDDLIPVDDRSVSDLRIRIPGRHLLKFVTWYNRGTSRETSPWREFREELLATGILPSDAFPFVFHDFIGRTVRPLRFSEYAQSWELLIADIYELLPTERQVRELETLKRRGHGDVIWADADRIRRRGAVPGQDLDTVIAEPADWTL